MIDRVNWISFFSVRGGCDDQIIPQRPPLCVGAFFALILCANLVAIGKEIDFVHDIAPILREHCGKCHIGTNKKGGLSFNSRATLIAGGDDGKVIEPGRSGESRLIAAVLSRDPDLQMPPQGTRLTEDQVERLKAWIDGGAAWDESFVFQKTSYEPALRPRRPELPPISDGRNNPIDRLLDAQLAAQKRPRPESLDDTAFARRTALDLTGLLPDTDRLREFRTDQRQNRREIWIQQLLADETRYAEHWLTFWNDLLRNDYGGTGFITGGRKQISKWLYQSLIDNKPYDQMARELIAPDTESAGFSEGIRWRGTVSAGQTVEIQFAQSVGQAFLGINFKCASCHDSFVDRWKLDEAYGLAAIFASQSMEIHRCDKPLGRQAEAHWPFPELGQIVATDPQPERVKQLASLMTHPENGRFSRTIVNRLWHRLMGRGIVHPVDAMQSEPWNADLLDFLAVDFADHRYDLKRTLFLIASSQAYQSRAEVIDDRTVDQNYVYAGPRAKRLTAEQFVDAVWQITGTAPTTIDAPVDRGRSTKVSDGLGQFTGQWVWSIAQASSAVPKPGEAITIRKQFSLSSIPIRAAAVMTCDNSCVCYLNGKKFFESDVWGRIEGTSIESLLRTGDNELVIVGRNGGSEPNPAAIIGELFIQLPDGRSRVVATDSSWEWTAAIPRSDGTFERAPTDWAPAVLVANPAVWAAVSNNDLLRALNQALTGPPPMVRASLLKSDFLQRTLGRPNRDQIVSTRPNELSTLEAIDLNNTQALADSLERGAKQWQSRYASKPKELVEAIYLTMLARPPSPEERSLAVDILGSTVDELAVQDLLWSILMQPEFQLVR